MVLDEIDTCITKQLKLISDSRMNMLQRMNKPWFIMINSNVNCNVLTRYMKNNLLVK